MIDKLTKEQEDLIPVWRDKWLAYGLSTEPTNREAAEEGARKAYEAVGLPFPNRIVWRESPLAGCIAAASLMSGKPEEECSLDEIKEQISKACYGQHDASWLGYYDYFLEVIQLDLKQLEGQIQVAQHAGWWWAFDEAVVLTERPTQLYRDDEGRLHCEDSAALLYKDGFAIWASHGVRVPKHVIENPEQITVKEIESEENVEVRRVMLERYGQERFLHDSNAQEIHRDDWGVLYRKEIPGDEALVMVKVVNSTPEPDGSFKDYFLRVPPTISTAQEAVAWSFDEPATSYSPIKET